MGVTPCYRVMLHVYTSLLCINWDVLAWKYDIIPIIYVMVLSGSGSL